MPRFVPIYMVLLILLSLVATIGAQEPIPPAPVDPKLTELTARVDRLSQQFGQFARSVDSTLRDVNGMRADHESRIKALESAEARRTRIAGLEREIEELR